MKKLILFSVIVASLAACSTSTSSDESIPTNDTTQVVVKADSTTAVDSVK